MHIPSLVIINFALSRTSTALPPLLLPPIPPSLNTLKLNATTLFQDPWPKVPWTYSIDESATICIEYYGRKVCPEDLHCEQRVMDGIDRILWTVKRDYVMAHEKIDSFAGGVVNFWIKQETMVPKSIVEGLIGILRWFVLIHGTTEVTHAGLVNFGTLAATFELTFPGIED